MHLHRGRFRRPLTWFVPMVTAALVLAGAPLATATDDTSGSPETEGRSASSDLFTPLEGYTPGARTAKTLGLDLEQDAAEVTGVQVDLDAVDAALAPATTPDPADVRTSVRGQAAAPTATVDLPTPDGGSQTFVVTETSVMQKKLAARHPELRTYAGHALGDVSTTVALDVTPLGLHASVRGTPEDDSDTGQTTWLVDPVTVSRGETRHVAYSAAALAESTPLEESVDEPVLARTATTSADTEDGTESTGQSGTRGRSAGGGGSSTDTRTQDKLAGTRVVRRTYRLALLNDPSYRKAVGGRANVLPAKVTMINRVNQVYNDDFAIRLVLVNGTGKLNLGTAAQATGADGPCGAHACFDKASDTNGYTPAQLGTCGLGTIGRSRTVLGQLIGAGSYDVGHVVLGKNGGGLAYLGVVGRDYAAGGCTGLPDPTGDVFYIDYVAHELGHQFAATHTFNGVGGACYGGNRTAAASVEPGSGSSVMAYAGICGADDLQNHTDPYFSQRSQTQVRRYIGSDQRRAVEVQTVSLRDFDPSSDTLSILAGNAAEGDEAVPVSEYSRAGLKAAVEEATGRTVTITPWGYDPYGTGSSRLTTVTAPDETGFQVVFADSVDPDARGRHVGAPALVVDVDSTASGSGATAEVGETTQGGPVDNQGTRRRTGNRRPVVTVPASRTIPTRTPFVVRGDATDADGDPLSLLWEQNDRGASSGYELVDNHRRENAWWGPLFRVFGTAAEVDGAAAHESPSPGQNVATRRSARWFPDLDQVLAGNTNADSGGCRRSGEYYPTAREAACFSEFLPTASWRGSQGTGGRQMHLRLTARDAVADGGGTSWAQTVLTVDPDAGPFRVYSQANGAAKQAGQRLVVKWRVNGTRKLARYVRIKLSLDGGDSWRMMRRKTLNDGRAAIRLPNRRSSAARVIVLANKNYFYDVNDEPFRIRR
ncbi:M12 family metallo-peptidase [Nocardioides bruguierae]|uniref:M12 family metallo-peptidase n=1 Tax=Nocardioides bruguierae TaxID=2945102 RepID=UPI0020208A9E|nr:M12 family metallo-peptidase [Nocardioides bruguierae]MCL8027603.1 M12 family metallo-peptidase [Nocardioides bruguierae]